MFVFHKHCIISGHFDPVQRRYWTTTKTKYVKKKPSCLLGRDWDVDGLWHDVISLWRRLWRAPAVYWFSELLCSHCYPRVLSTVQWTHTAPRAAISARKPLLAALSTGLSHSTQACIPFMAIHAYISIASAEEAVQQHMENRGIKLSFARLWSLSYESGGFFQMRDLDWDSTASCGVWAGCFWWRWKVQINKTKSFISLHTDSAQSPHSSRGGKASLASERNKNSPTAPRVLYHSF